MKMNKQRLSENAWWLWPCESHRQQERYGGSHLGSSNDGMTYRSGEAERGCSCCSSRTWWRWSRSEDMVVVAGPVAVLAGPTPLCARLFRMAFFWGFVIVKEI